MKDKKSPEYLSVSEVANMFGLSTQTVYRWIRSGEMRAYSLGSPGIVRIRPEDLPIEIISNPLTEEESSRISELSRELTDLLTQSQNSLQFADTLDPSVWIEDSAQAFLYELERKQRETDFEAEKIFVYPRDVRSAGKYDRAKLTHILRGISCYHSNDEITNQKEVLDQCSFAIFDTENVLDIEVSQGKPWKSRIVSGKKAQQYLEKYKQLKRKSMQLSADKYKTWTGK